MSSIAKRSNVYMLGPKQPVPPGIRCHYCTDYAGTRDHIVPRSLGGLDRVWNLVPACGSCNLAKSSLVPDCACEWCRKAVERYRAGDRKPIIKSMRVRVKRRDGAWLVVTPMVPDKAERVAFRTFRRAIEHAEARGKRFES